MPEMISNSPARLYVGFGGSGMKTLAELTAAIARNAEWGPDVETNLAFLLVDTNIKDIEKWGEQIRSTCRKIAREPIVRVIHLSKGRPTFQDRAAAVFERHSQNRRLRRAWWFDDDLRPFTAHKFRQSPELGAGQCPLISAFLAWDNIGTIEDEVAGIVDEFKRRLTQFKGNQAWTLSATFVAGLAGGTGRGCWSILAAKVREVLGKIDRPTTPSAFFYDASVFRHVITDPDEKLKTQVNALTGFSELTAWLKKGEQRGSDPFFIPSLDNPDDPAHDAIDTSRVAGETNPAGHSPVDEADVIFSQGRAGRLGDPEQYYQIVANALYSRLIGDIAGATANASGFGGVGSTTISVPVEDIRDYVADYKKFYVPDVMVQSGDAAELDRWAALLAQPCLISSRFSEPKKDGNFGERILHFIQAKADLNAESVEKAIVHNEFRAAEKKCHDVQDWPSLPSTQKSIKDEASTLTRQLYWGGTTSFRETVHDGLLFDLGALHTFGEVEYARIFGGDVNSRAVESAVSPIASAIKRLLMQDKLVRTNKEDGTTDELALGSFEVKAVLATKIAEALKASAKSLSDLALQPAAIQAKTPKDVFARAREGFLNSSITTDELRGIMQAVRDWPLQHSMPALQKAVVPILTTATGEIEKFARDLRTIVETLQRERSKAWKSLENKQDIFWNDNDFNRLLSQPMGEVFDRELLSEQRLQPVFNEGDTGLRDALTELWRGGDNPQFSKERDDFKLQLAKWLNESSSDSDTTQREQDLGQIIKKRCLALANSLAIPQQFYVREYGFSQVVRGLLARWGTELKKRAGNADQKAKLESAFRIQFGDTYPMDEDGKPIQYRDEELVEFTREILKAMAVELAVRSDVLFEVKTGAGSRAKHDQATVVLPAEDRFNDEFRKDVYEEARKKGRFEDIGALKVVETFGKHNGGNPFMMLGYATERFPADYDAIASLQYHRGSPELRLWLEACEDPDGRSVFMPEGSGLVGRDIYGLGFISPEFVKNEAMAALRWAPWRKGDNAGSQVKRKEAFDALAFAMLDEPATDAAVELIQLNSAEQWDMPLLSLAINTGDDKQQFSFLRSAFRLPKRQTDLATKVADHPAITAGNGFTTIGKLVDTFEQSVDSENGLVAAIANEAVMYLTILEKHEPDNKVSPPAALRMMWENLEKKVEQAKSNATGPKAEEFRNLFDELLSRIDVLLKLSPAKLKEHFEQIGSG